MGFRFHRSIRLLPGVRLNISKKGLGLSAGIKGFHISTGPTGVRRTISIPGTGISKIDQLSPPPGKKSPPIQHEIQDSSSSIIQNSLTQPSAKTLISVQQENIVLQKPAYNTTLNDPVPHGILFAIIVIGILAVSSLIYLISVINQPSIDTEPANSVEQIVNTSIAGYTQQAIVTQMFFVLTETSLADQIFIEQTQTACVPTLPQPTDTPVFQIPTDQPAPVRGVVIPTADSLPAAIPAPLVATQVFPDDSPQPSIQTCCKVCKSGKACGDSCISKNKTCNSAPGCACDG